MTIFRFQRYERYNGRTGNRAAYLGTEYARENLGTRASMLLTARRMTAISVAQVKIKRTPHRASGSYDLVPDGADLAAQALVDGSTEKVGTAFDIEMPSGFRTLRRLWPVRTGLSRSLLSLTTSQVKPGQWINTLESAAPYTLRSPTTARMWRRYADGATNPTLTRIAQRAGDALAKD